MKLFSLKSLKLKNSLIIISVMVPLLVFFLAYDLDRQSVSMRDALTERGIILARTGAEATSKILGDAVQSGALTQAQLFDTDYKPVPGTDPQKYHTAYDSYTDANLRQIEDSYLKDKVVVFAVAVDTNGYLPTHNSIFSVSGGGINTDRSKRLFNDTVGLAAAQNREPYLFQEYRRDTGETMWDISAPVYVNGRHWGAFRIGFSIDETNKQIAAIRNQIIGGGAVLIAAMIILILYISHLITTPVKRLEQEANRVARGDLTAVNLSNTSEDEVGKLLRSFGNMVDKLRNLVEKTRTSADHVSVYLRQLQDSIKNAADTASVTAGKMSQLTETMKKMEGGSETVVAASKRTIDSLLKTETASEKFLRKMKASSTVMIRAGESVADLGSHVEKVRDITQFIALIADQASLLSRKAVAEVAQSTGAGSNFAALASEIQKRSQDAATAIKDISGQFEKALKHAQEAAESLEQDQQVVLEGYNAAGEASRSLKSIVSEMQDLTGQVQEVISYTQQVTAGIGIVNEATKEQTALLKGFTGASGMLDEALAEMQETLMSLKV